jgi:hypothetical protein
VSRMPGKLRFTAACCAVGVGITTGAQAAATPQLDVLDRPAQRLHRSLEVNRLVDRYGDLLSEARKLKAAPDHDLLDRRATGPAALRHGIEALDDRVTDARREQRPDFGLAPGVSQATLDAIAACESGGDPTAVDASGTYYGKYQFDTGTWAAVGGSGSAAAAPEAEQDYRASLLYSQAGSSPWPVCGQ